MTTTKRKTPTLPNKPSALVRVARRDLIACMKQPKKFAINMGTWMNQYHPDGPCTVCQAGAVMARTLKIKPTYGRETYPSEAVGAGRTHSQLSALNYLRGGGTLGVECFLQELDMPREYRYPKWMKTAYATFEDNSKKYLKWLERVELWLRRKGL